jgi:hypothetical protein
LLLVLIAAAWTTGICLVLGVCAPLLGLATRVDRPVELTARLDPLLDRLESVRGPAQQPFYPTPRARADLARALLRAARDGA